MGWTQLDHPFMVRNQIHSLPLPRLFRGIKRVLEAYKATEQQCSGRPLILILRLLAPETALAQCSSPWAPDSDPHRPAPGPPLFVTYRCCCRCCWACFSLRWLPLQLENVREIQRRRAEEVCFASSCIQRLVVLMVGLGYMHRDCISASGFGGCND